MEAIMEENRLLLITIEDEYKSKKEIAKFLWKRQELVTDFQWLNIVKANKMLTEHFTNVKKIFASMFDDSLDLLQNNDLKIQEKLWEILYGSWSWALNNIIKEKINIANTIKFLVERTKIVKYIIEQLLITNETSSNFLDVSQPFSN